MSGFKHDLMTFKYCCIHILLLDLVEGKLQEIKGVKPVHLSLSQFWDPPLKKKWESNMSQ